MENNHRALHQPAVLPKGARDNQEASAPNERFEIAHNLFDASTIGASERLPFLESCYLK